MEDDSAKLLEMTDDSSAPQFFKLTARPPERDKIDTILAAQSHDRYLSSQVCRN